MAAIPEERGVLGVLGGMGPLASAEFIKSIYTLNTFETEQDMPRVLLDSDPLVPDRTQAIQTGIDRQLRERLGDRLAGLAERGATAIVIACFTAHHYLAGVEPTGRRNVVSLVDITLDGMVAASGRFLMLCTSGTRQARVFQNAPSWPAVARQIVMPDRRDAELIHKMVYRMKRNKPMSDVVPTIDLLLSRYGCTGVVCGCTEFHLVSGELVARYGEANVIDALRAIAIGLPELLATQRSVNGPEPAGIRGRAAVSLPRRQERYRIESRTS